MVVRQPALSGGGPGGHTVFVKGSPEMIRTLVQPQTVPAGEGIAAHGEQVYGNAVGWCDLGAFCCHVWHPSASIVMHLPNVLRMS